MKEVTKHAEKELTKARQIKAKTERSTKVGGDQSQNAQGSLRGQ